MAQSYTIKHGASYTVEYACWSRMRQRCRDPHLREWPRYGGRGITVCDRWASSFTNFYADMGPRPSALHTLDRMNNDAGYSPMNCRWATRNEQCVTRSGAITVLLRGRQVTMRQAAPLMGIKYCTAYKRVKDSGMSPSAALGLPEPPGI
jgi:hypothetical protein